MPWSNWFQGCSAFGARTIIPGSRKDKPEIGSKGPKQRAWTMTDHHVLLVGSSDRRPAELTSMIERDSKNRIGAEATTAVQQALALLSEKGYDAVVCWVEREDELAGVIRIRKANPQLPILVMTSQEAP